MVKFRSGLWFGSWLALCALFTEPKGAVADSAQAPPPPAASVPGRPSLLVGVAIDEAGITQGDLRRSQDLVLALLDSLPEDSQMMVASFSGDKRIVLPPTADRKLLGEALQTFSAGGSGVALPDGLFDIVEYLGSRDADARALLLVSSGRLREGDLQFEDPLNAATSKGIPIFALALGQGDGKLLRRIAKITGGDYVRLEVADASMLARAIVPSTDSAPSTLRTRPAETAASKPEPRNSNGLLGAAAIFFSLGGLLMLAIVVLLIRRMGTPSSGPKSPVKAAVPKPVPSPAEALRWETSASEDETILEKTLVVNVNPILRALSGPGAGKNFPIKEPGPTSIGRSRRNDIVVPEDAASAQHCRIDREGDSYVLHDLGATNGTWVNGAKMERAVLQHGDRLKIGETVFTVSLFGDRS